MVVIYTLFLKSHETRIEQVVAQLSTLGSSALSQSEVLYIKLSIMLILSSLLTFPKHNFTIIFLLGAVGHCHPQVVLAGKNQMATLVTAQGFVNDLLNKYVKELTSHLPDSLNVVYLVNSG